MKILNTDFQLIWYYNDNLERVYNKQLNRIDVHQYNILKPVNFAFLIQLGAKIEDATKKNKIDNTRTINSIKSRIFFIKNR
jgi:predicted nucleotidyltransferase